VLIRDALRPLARRLFGADLGYGLSGGSTGGGSSAAYVSAGAELFGLGAEFRRWPWQAGTGSGLPLTSTAGELSRAGADYPLERSRQVSLVVEASCAADRQRWHVGQQQSSSQADPAADHVLVRS
jgi:hypothetical protein